LFSAGFQRLLTSSPTCLTLLLGLLICLPAFAQTARFTTVDVFVDSHDQALAAYQLEVTSTRGNARIVGIEGGETAPFTPPPYYDPRAMQQERVILAAYNRGLLRSLPKGRTRVATLHVQVSGNEAPEFAIKLVTVGNGMGYKIKASASIEERKTK
jgi:hypothetical protein